MDEEEGKNPRAWCLVRGPIKWGFSDTYTIVRRVWKKCGFCEVHISSKRNLTEHFTAWISWISYLYHVWWSLTSSHCLTARPLHSIFYFWPLNVLMLGGGINPFPSDNEPDSVVGRVGMKCDQWIGQSCIEWGREWEAECSSLILCDIESMARSLLSSCVKWIITTQIVCQMPGHIRFVMCKRIADFNQT